MYMIKQLSLLLLIILTICCDGNITGPQHYGTPVMGYKVDIDHITYTIDGYISDLRGIEGTLTNIGDTTITAPFWITGDFFSDTTISNHICGWPPDNKSDISLPPGESIFFTLVDYDSSCPNFPSFSVGNFSVYKEILYD